ncbi:MAG TPA: TIGR00296 family protein [Thermoplasmata archaeon]|nr:TIGR00296 family protein [Thermoplasmata archaeon]
MTWSAEEARAAVDLARRAVAAHLGPNAPADPAAPFRGAPLPPVFDERLGVFVTLKRASDHALRGCIGYPRPHEPLRSAIPRVAVASAVEDPRFPPVAAPELSRLLVEISVLTAPVLVPGRTASERRASIVVGRDGLIIEGRGGSGLLLPQVPVEQGWSVDEFLAGICEKAGLFPDAWIDLTTRLYRFEAVVFGETAPAGAVAFVPLSPTSGPAP